MRFGHLLMKVRKSSLMDFIGLRSAQDDELNICVEYPYVDLLGEGRGVPYEDLSADWLPEGFQKLEFLTSLKGNLPGRSSVYVVVVWFLQRKRLIWDWQLVSIPQPEGTDHAVLSLPIGLSQWTQRLSGYGCRDRDISMCRRSPVTLELTGVPVTPVIPGTTLQLTISISSSVPVCIIEATTLLLRKEVMSPRVRFQKDQVSAFERQLDKSTGARVLVRKAFFPRGRDPVFVGGTRGDVTPAVSTDLPLTVPLNTPDTWKGGVAGSFRYRVVLRVHFEKVDLGGSRPPKEVRVSTRKDLLVRNQLVLTRRMERRLGENNTRTGHEEETWPRGEVKATVRIESPFIVHGDTVPVRLDVINDSNKTIRYAALSLKQVFLVILPDGRYLRRVQDTVCKVRVPGARLQPHDTCLNELVELPVPTHALSTASMTGCSSIVVVMFYIRLKLKWYFFNTLECDVWVDVATEREAEEVREGRSPRQGPAQRYNFRPCLETIEEEELRRSLRSSASSTSS
ncbi:uncharacterized protein LOC143297515 [Babylonia areolata]|uniref:uncharacterized protein LOC143297515 n=1 Tax=Babylonia areolata TaxID=304850 RepID=UPI003FD51604